MSFDGDTTSSQLDPHQTFCEDVPTVEYDDAHLKSIVKDETVVVKTVAEIDKVWSSDLDALDALDALDSSPPLMGDYRNAHISSYLYEMSASREITRSAAQLVEILIVLRDQFCLCFPPMCYRWHWQRLLYADCMAEVRIYQIILTPTHSERAQGAKLALLSPAPLLHSLPLATIHEECYSVDSVVDSVVASSKQQQCVLVTTKTLMRMLTDLHYHFTSKLRKTKDAVDFIQWHARAAATEPDVEPIINFEETTEQPSNFPVNNTTPSVKTRTEEDVPSDSGRPRRRRVDPIKAKMKKARNVSPSLPRRKGRRRGNEDEPSPQEDEEDNP